MTDDLKVSVPEGQSGDWAVQRFTVSKEASEIDRFRAVMHGSARFCPPGTYTRLIHGGHTIMSDTPDEMRDFTGFLWHARGNVLINGLGLGACLQACLYRSDVQHATVVEISPDVIALVAEHYRKMFGDRVTIIEGNAFTWNPPKGVIYDAVWHDIWADIDEDNLPEMHRLHRRYARRARWQGSWSRGILEREKQRNRWRAGYP